MQTHVRRGRETAWLPHINKHMGNTLGHNFLRHESEFFQVELLPFCMPIQKLCPEVLPTYLNFLLTNSM